MLKTRLKDGTLLFLPDDYEDALVDAVAEVMGEDIAGLLDKALSVPVKHIIKVSNFPVYFKHFFSQTQTWAGLIR